MKGLALLGLLALSVACDRSVTPACSQGTVSMNGACVSTDASIFDAKADTGSERDAPQEAGPPPPLWASGGWRLPWRDLARPLPPGCGPGEPQASWVYQAEVGGFCAGAGWVELGSFGEFGTLRQGDPTLHFFQAQTPERRINLGCATRSLIAGVTDFASRRAALLRFADPWAAGEVLWEQHVKSPGRSGVGIGRVAASDQITAFRFHDGSTWVYTGGPRGANLRVEPLVNQMLAGRDIENFQADGAHLVIEASNDVFLYTRSSDGTGVLQNLTPLPAGALDPWVSGRYVVWTDRRHPTGATNTQLDNTEVYLYDIETRAERRITNDPPERPALQFNARVVGDWIVWLDQRHAPQPNVLDQTSAGTPREIYGYHIPTGREVPLVTGAHFLGNPMLADGHLWYTCWGRSPQQFEGVYRMRMPPPP